MVVIVVFYRRLGEDGGDEFCSERSHQSKKKERKQDAQFRASQWFRGVVHGSGGLIVQLVKADGIVSCGFRSVKINLVTDWVVWGTRGTTQQRSSSIFFFLLETLVNSSGMGTDVHSLMLSIQHFFC